jgi:hypothetical protein
MAEIRTYPILRHLRAEPSFHILRFRRGKQVASGRGLAFWFRPLSTSVAEIPMDDRELPFLFHGRTQDFQDATVQGVITFRVIDPEKVAERVDFAIDLRTGVLLKQPLEKLAGLLTELAQQFALGYLAQTPLRHALAEGVAEIRERIGDGLCGEAGMAEMGLDVVAVRVGAVKPVAEVEKALQIEFGGVGVGLADARDVAKSEFLHETVLERQVGAFDTSLGLERVRTDDLDVELGEGAAKLREAVAPLAPGSGDAEDARLVAVECDGLPEALQIGPGGREVPVGRLGDVEAKLHETAGRVVDIDKQGALRRAVLEPGVLADRGPVPRIMINPRGISA